MNVTMPNKTVIFSDTKMGAPIGFSYHCSQEVVFKDGNNKLNISSDFQVLYFFLQCIRRICRSETSTYNNLPLCSPCLNLQVCRLKDEIYLCDISCL